MKKRIVWWSSPHFHVYICSLEKQACQYFIVYLGGLFGLDELIGYLMLAGSLTRDWREVSVFQICRKCY